MFRFRSVISFFLLSLAFLLSATIDAAEENLKIMTYNIRNGIGIDGTADLSRIADVIKRCDPDIVAVQEVDSMTNRSGKRDILAELGKQTGLNPIYCPAIDYDGGRYGIGMLCSVMPDSIIRLSLPGREEERAALIAIWPHIAVACTHLSLTPDDRDCGASMIADAIMPLMAGGREMIITGDFNADYNDPLFEMLQQTYQLRRPYGFQATYPSDTPTEMIDHFLISPDPGIINSVEVLNSQASDHRPLIVTINKK